MNDRQIQIISAATTLFLNEGVGVSTASIAKAAGVSNGTLFNAFATKQDLIDAIYHRAKTAMFDALHISADTVPHRDHIKRNWDSYLTWARANPEERRVMHLLQVAGLASQSVQIEIAQRGAPHADWVRRALDQGYLCAPNVEYVCALLFFHLDLAIAQDLTGDDLDLAFDMLCNSIGLTT